MTTIHRATRWLLAAAGVAPGRELDRAGIVAAIHKGTSDRVRPIVMTATAVVVGLTPVMAGSGTGSQITQRIAAPMIGGMITTTLLSLLVLPVIYGSVLTLREKFRARGR